MEREIAGVGLYKLEIEFVVGSILNLWLFSPSSASEALWMAFAIAAVSV